MPAATSRSVRIQRDTLHAAMEPGGLDGDQDEKAGTSGYSNRLAVQAECSDGQGMHE